MDWDTIERASARETLEMEKLFNRPDVMDLLDNGFSISIAWDADGKERHIDIA